MSDIQEGDHVTARIQGKIRGGIVRQVLNENGLIIASFPLPGETIRTFLKSNEYQKSELWDDPEKKKAL